MNGGAISSKRGREGDEKEMTMNTPIRTLAAIALINSSPAFAAQDSNPQAGRGDAAAPTSAAPTQAPPIPEANPGAPTAAAPSSTAPPATAPQALGTLAPGQWSYTSQYGWVYLPYAQNYTYVNPDGSVAYEYAYYPARGWAWIEAPWVLGWGPHPYWGYYGYRRFAWYAHPWFRAGGYYRGGFGYRGGWGHPRAGYAGHWR
jgi:hypothetical protein